VSLTIEKGEKMSGKGRGPAGQNVLLTASVSWT